MRAKDRIRPMTRTSRYGRQEVDGVTFHEDFLNVVARIGLSQDEAVAFAETFSNRPFEACTPTELLPVLDNLLALAQRNAATARGPACGA